MSGDPDRVLIIGGGFSGAALAIQLAARGVASTIVEARGRAARGAAYSTSREEHLLNVPAGKMGLWPDRPEGFAEHAEEEGVSAQDFVSRRQFGDYVEAELARAAKDGKVRIVRDRAVRAGPEGLGWAITLAGGQTLHGRALVLANGNQPPAPFVIPGLKPERMIDNPWSDAGRAAIAALAGSRAPVLLVGTGLTMVDVVLTLATIGFAGRISALSRRGQVPRGHSTGVMPRPTTLDEVPERLSDAVRWMRDRAEGQDWRGLVDGLRPITQAIWQRMDRPARGRFLRHLRPWWDVHRHRIAPQAAAGLHDMLDSGQLEVVAGRVVEAVEADDGARIAVDRRGGGRGLIEAETVINCTGPLARIDQADDELLQQMLADRLVSVDADGLGLKVDAHNRLEGSMSAWAVGPMTKGRYWEITAVPDIRVQAAEIANDIAAHFGSVPA